MDKFTSKRRSKPTDICQYGKNCYRKNPHHFMEYTHEHLDKIMEQNTANQPDQYVIPDDMAAQKDLILDQIKVINELFPKLKTEEPSAKKNKSDEQDTTISKASASETDGNKFSSQRSTSVNSASASAAASSTSTPHNHSAPTVDIHKYIKVVLPKGKMAEKLRAAHPFNYFLTCIPSSPRTHTEPLSITFQEILDKSLGELESSVQINFMVEPGWLLGQYYFAGYLHLPLLILYGSATSNELETISQKKPNITAHFVKMPTPFSTHHTKMMLLGYKDGSMRVVVSTANLYEDDWNNRTQGSYFNSINNFSYTFQHHLFIKHIIFVKGLWISDKLEALPEGSDTAAGESPTEFRNELLKYLASYKLPQLQPWLVRIRKSNFSSVILKFNV